MTRIEFLNNLNKYKDKDELMHYGTIGQKWGVRKWQNYDGTFNEAGKERYFGKSSKSKSTEEEKVGSNKSNIKDYLKFRNKMLKQRTRSDLNQWYRDKVKQSDKQLIKDAKRVDKQQMKMYKNQLKDFYDDPEELVNDLDRMYRIGGQRKEKSKQEINDIVNKRNTEMLNDENEDILIGSNPDKKAYKAKVKELKKQAKEMGIPFGERGHLAKYCAKNGIEEITEKIVEGHKAGDKLWEDSINMNSATNQIDRYIRTSNRSERVLNDKNVKEFTENNKNYKQYEKDLQDLIQQKVKMNAEYIKLVKKAGLNPTLIDTTDGSNTKVIDKSKYEKNSKEYKILQDCMELIKKDKTLQNQFFKLEDKARASLGHFEKDCHDFAKEYLVDQAEYNDPFEYAYTYEKDTGKVRNTKLYETYAYLMTEPYWDAVGGP